MSYVYCGWLDSALKWILNNIISPVFNCIKGVLSSVFSFIYSNVLGPILDKTVYAAGRWLWERILDNFFSALYSLAKMALQILDCLSDLFDTLLGVQPVIFKGEETTLLRAFLNMDAVRRAFWYINFFALGLAIIFAIYGVTRSMLDFDFENKRPVSRVMSSLLSSVLNLFTVQLAVFGIIYLAEAILTGLNSAMALAGGAAGNTTLGRMIFVLGTLNAANDESFNLSSDAVQSGSKIVGPTDSIRSKFFESSGLSPYKLSDVKIYFNVRKLDYIILIGLGLVFSFLLLIALIAVVRRLFNLLLLYIVSPLFAATIPLDDGEHFGKWRNLFVGTCFTGYGMLVAMKLYLLICPTIMGSELTMSASVELNFVCKVVFLLGGLWAVYKSSSMITSLISAEAGNAEGEAMAKGKEIGDLVKGGLWSLVKAGDRSKNKEGKEGQDGQDGKLGEGSQRFNGKNTGAAGTGDHGKDNAFQGDMRNRNDKLEGAGKKDNKDKNSSLFQGKAKPGKTGKLGAQNRTLDKFRKQFDMDNAGDLDKENPAEAGPSKNKNAFQERKGRKTTDSLGLGAKKLDAMRSKFRLDAGANAANAGDGQKELEGENTLDTTNKPGTNKVKTKTDGQNGKLEGQNDKKASGVAAAAGRRDDSGIVAQHPKLELDDQKSGGAFGGTSKGQDDMKLSPRKRPNIDAMSAAKDAVNTANKPADTKAPVQNENVPAQSENEPAGVPVEGNNVFNGKNNGVPSKPAEMKPSQKPAEGKVDVPKNNNGTTVPKAGASKVEDTGNGFDAGANDTSTETKSGVFRAEGDNPSKPTEMKPSQKPAEGQTNIPKNDTKTTAPVVEGGETGFGVGSNGIAPESDIDVNRNTFSTGGNNNKFSDTPTTKTMNAGGNAPAVETGSQGNLNPGEAGMGVQNPTSEVLNSNANPSVQKQGTSGTQKFGQNQETQQGGVATTNGPAQEQNSFQEPGATQQFGSVSGQPNMQTKQGGAAGFGSNSATETSNVGMDETSNLQAQNLDLNPNKINDVNLSPQNTGGVGMGSSGQANGVHSPGVQTFGQGEGVPTGSVPSSLQGGVSGTTTTTNVGGNSVNPANPSPREEIPGGVGGTAGSQSYMGGQKVSAGTQTQESGMGGYARDDDDYVSGRASTYRSNVLNGRAQAGNGPTLMSDEITNHQSFDSNVNVNNIHQTVGGHNTQTMQTTQTKTTQTNQTSTVHNDVNRVQMENQSTIDTQTSKSQTIFTGNNVKMESQGTQTYESTQGFTGGNNTVNMRSNNFASNDNVGYNNIHQSADGEFGAGGRSYAKDDFGIDYGGSGTAQHTAYTQTQTETQNIRTDVRTQTEFKASESKLETEMNSVATDTQKIHDEAQKEKSKKNSDDKK